MAHQLTAHLQQEDELEERAYVKVTWRLVPFLCLCFVIAFLDRVNIAFAKLQMVSELGWSEQIYGFGAGIFFLAYFICEVPSNLIMHRVGARRWIARIMISWAVLTGMMAFVHSTTAFYVIRFLIGAAEAGFFPGIILYLTYWYPAKRRSRVIATFMTAIPIAGVSGGILSGWILSTFHGEAGLSGWQWLFLLECVPSLIVGIAALFYLDDGIRNAKWLNEEARSRLIANIEAEAKSKQAVSVAAAVRRPAVWVLALAYFGAAMGQYGFGFWLPSIIKHMGVSSTMHVGLLSAVPYVFGIVAMLAVGRSADRSGEHRWHYLLPCAAAALGLVASALFSHQQAFSFGALTVACMGLQCLAPVFWRIPTSLLGGVAAAAGIALINSIANLAGFVSPYMIGWIVDRTGSTNFALYVIAAFLLLSAVVVFALPHSTERSQQSTT
ncbi:MFS transporter [Paraburkholderia diazotrophica]|uniref:Putative tartrate transporter n=1 Tax=Paraburkholderia diazotrophica TaxID=667676 RepID=A0A1H7C6R1_9BURK|nr:MFS transporter [Paraburkholderia diazotrophica]SEJ85136.1 D-galactonate transporter [Paraburkholderia diazotrophica]